MTQIDFDEAAHVYTVDGIARRSVTQVIGAAALVDDRWYTEEAMQRGTAVHRACHYLDQNDLDESWIERSPHAGYVKAWVKFKADTEFQCELIEHRVYHQQFDYCGTLDRTGRLRASKHADLFLIDLKTGPPQEWHGLQTVAYAGTFDRPMRYRQATVHLRNDGSYNLTEYPAATHAQRWNVFCACLEIEKFKSGRKENARSHRPAKSSAA